MHGFIDGEVSQDLKSYFAQPTTAGGRFQKTKHKDRKREMGPRVKDSRTNLDPVWRFRKLAVSHLKTCPVGLPVEFAVIIQKVIDAFLKTKLHFIIQVHAYTVTGGVRINQCLTTKKPFPLEGLCVSWLEKLTNFDQPSS